MRLFRNTGAVNWKYAFGELSLITIGVFIALAASDWQKNRDARQTEIAILSEMHRSLLDDVRALNQLIEHSTRNHDQSKALLDLMNSDAEYSSEFDEYFGTLYCLSRLQLNNAVYESLKSNNLFLISNESLRSKIAHVYEVRYRTVVQEMDSERNIVWERVGPYMYANFRNVRPCETAIPLDYQQLKSDQLFRNLVELRLNGQAIIYGPVWSAAIADVRNLIEDISVELRL